MTMTTYKVNPYNITDYNRSEKDLELFLLFCIVVAGKTAYIQADKLDQFLISIKDRLMMPDNTSSFQIIKSADQHGILLQEIQEAKLGQYKKINAAFKFISENKIDELNKHKQELITNVLNNSEYDIENTHDLKL